MVALELGDGGMVTVHRGTDPQERVKPAGVVGAHGRWKNEGDFHYALLPFRHAHPFAGYPSETEDTPCFFSNLITVSAQSISSSSWDTRIVWPHPRRSSTSRMLIS